MAVEVELRDGTPGVIWSLLPQDRSALALAYERLSPTSKFHRFLTGVPHLSDEMLDHLVDGVDGVDHVALVLLLLDDDAVPVAVTHAIRYSDDPSAADVAVTVADEFHGRGAASALLSELMRQRPKGVQRIKTVVAADNPASLAMLRRLGATTVTEADDVLHVVVELPSP